MKSKKSGKKSKQQMLKTKNSESRSSKGKMPKKILQIKTPEKNPKNKIRSRQPQTVKKLSVTNKRNRKTEVSNKKTFSQKKHSKATAQKSRNRKHSSISQKRKTAKEKVQTIGENQQVQTTQTVQNQSIANDAQTTLTTPIQENQPKPTQPESESEIAQIQKEYSDLNAYLIQRRKAGVDTFIQELKLFPISYKIQLLKAEYSREAAEKLRAQISEIRAELEKAQPSPTPLDEPKIDQTSAAGQASAQQENSPTSQDAENYSKELSEKRLSSRIKASITNASKRIFGIFRKGG